MPNFSIFFFQQNQEREREKLNTQKNMISSNSFLKSGTFIARERVKSASDEWMTLHMRLYTHAE